MKTNPNKLITFVASFTDADPELSKDISHVTARLYRDDEHITDLAVKQLKPLQWTANYIFPKESEMGEYQTVFEVKIKDQKESLTQTQYIDLVRDVNLDVKMNIGKEIPQIIVDEQYDEIPTDIKKYLVKKNES